MWPLYLRKSKKNHFQQYYLCIVLIVYVDVFYTTRRNAFIGHARQLAAVKLGRLVLMLFYFYFILAQLVNFCTNKQYEWNCSPWLMLTTPRTRTDSRTVLYPSETRSSAIAE